MSLYVMGIVALVVVAFAAIFFWTVLQMARDPDPPSSIDPETRTQLARMQMRGVRRGEAADGSTFHAPASRSRWEGGSDDVS